MNRCAARELRPSAWRPSRICEHPAEPRIGQAREPRSGRSEAEWLTHGTDNVFADLGFPDADGRRARLRLAYALKGALEARRLSRAAAAEALRVTEPSLLALRQYRLSGFSLERLMNLVTAVGFDVEIVI